MIPFLNNVMERAGSARRADGSEPDVTRMMNPMWAQWFDQAEEATGGPVVFGQRGSSLNKLPTSPGQGQQGESLAALRRLIGRS